MFTVSYFVYRLCFKDNFTCFFSYILVTHFVMSWPYIAYYGFLSILDRHCCSLLFLLLKTAKTLSDRALIDSVLFVLRWHTSCVALMYISVFRKKSSFSRINHYNKSFQFLIPTTPTKNMCETSITKLN